MGISSWIRGGDPTDPNSRAYAREAMRKRRMDALQVAKDRRASKREDWAPPMGIERPFAPEPRQPRPQQPILQPNQVQKQTPTPFVEPDQAPPMGIERPSLEGIPRSLTAEERSQSPEERRANFKVIKGEKEDE